MMPDHWDRIRELFEDVSRHPPEERREAVRKLCPDDADLQNEVLSLLEHDAQAEPQFLSPLERPATQTERDGPDPLIGTRLGKYMIRRVIAAGGMGVVYEAEQENPRRNVAVKVLKSLAWSRIAKRRFEFEVQSLARLTHPHIAQIYDADTARLSGLGEDTPYFVMELIPDACPITEYADRHKLDRKQRLELFLQVCDAVHYGHQRGIIHRDLKPANILVCDGELHHREHRGRREKQIIEVGAEKTARKGVELSSEPQAPARGGRPPLPSGEGRGEGDSEPQAPARGGFHHKEHEEHRDGHDFVLVPEKEGSVSTSIDNRKSTIDNLIVKVIDFGVARATDCDVAATTQLTDVGQLIGTLRYMSPEQCASDPLGLDVRSDVYALGVILYELLCGQMPYRHSPQRTQSSQRKIQSAIPVVIGNEPNPSPVSVSSVPSVVNEPFRPSDSPQRSPRARRAQDQEEPQGDNPPSPWERERVKANSPVGEKSPISVSSASSVVHNPAVRSLANEPFRPTGTAYAWIKAICEEPAIRPGTIERSLRGDMEIILLKALEKDREKRYQSVADLARDLRHYLNREPLEARGPSFAATMHNWIRMHPVTTTALAAATIGSAVLAAFFLSLWYFGYRPYGVIIQKKGREVSLVSAVGGILHTWKASNEGSFAIADLVEEPGKTLAIIGESATSGTPFSGMLRGFDIDARQYEVAIWTDRVLPSDMPSAEPDRGFKATDFAPGGLEGRPWVYDIFPSIPGREVVVPYFHPNSRRLLRVLSLDGRVLWQVWHDGGINEVLWLEKPRLLIVGGTNDEVPWPQRGGTIVRRLDGYYPWVLWSVRPTLGAPRNQYLCTDRFRPCVEAVWYKCVLPESATDVFKSIHVEPPSQPSANDGWHFQITFDYSVGQKKPEAGWLLDTEGKIVGQQPFKNDAYLEIEKDLPRIEDFRLDDLPPIHSKPNDQSN